MLIDHFTTILPVYNEINNLKVILPYLTKTVGELIVIDGHSNDDSFEFAQNYTKHVFRDKGLGKGQALRQAIEIASKPVIVFIDADLSHSPFDIKKLVTPIFAGRADHVTGSRMIAGSDELHGDLNKFLRMIGSDIITLGINYRFGVRLTDSQNGFRSIRTDVARALNLKEVITTIEQEMIIRTLLNHYIITEVPTHEYSRLHGTSSIHLRKVAFRYVYSWLKLLIHRKEPITEVRNKREKLWDHEREIIYKKEKKEIDKIMEELDEISQWYK